jgi:transposase-like protein
MRNALAHVSRGQRTAAATAIRQVFDEPDRSENRERLQAAAICALCVAFCDPPD